MNLTAGESPVAGPEGCALEGLRGQTYRLLGALLRRAPDAELLQALRDADGDPAEGEVGRAWASLAEMARDVDPSAVDDEYHDLFIGLGRGELLPYASYYLSGCLMGRPLAALRGDLASLGFEREAGVSEPEDHAGALMDVMAVLADPGQGEPLEVQQRFFTAHLADWVGVFFDDLQQADKARFYRSIGALGRAFFDLECGYLGVAAQAQRRRIGRSQTGEVR